LEWPVNAERTLDVLIFQSLMLVSFEELARMFFVGWNATPVISLPKF